VRVPGGNVGNSGNGNVGINVTNPNATLDVNGTATNGIIKVTATNTTGIGAPGQEPIYITPFAFQLDFDETIYQPTGLSTQAVLTAHGRWFLGDFNGNYTATSYLNVKNAGIAVHGTNQSRLNLSYHNTYGNLISWYSPATAIQPNLAFGFEGAEPFLLLTQQAQVLIGTELAPADYKLCIGGKAIAEEVVVRLQNTWPDYVFAPEYTMLTNAQLRQYITENGKLPYLPAAAEVAENGVALGETQTHRALSEKGACKRRCFVLPARKARSAAKTPVVLPARFSPAPVRIPSHG
jgi:hypothetical protein